MARTKKAGKALLDAKQRLAGQNSIDKTLDLGSGLTNAEYAAKVQAGFDALDDYNESLSVSDQKLNIYNAKVKEVKTYSERSLKAVGVKYGFDSDEYEMAGGTRKSEYKKRPSKKTPQP